MVFKSCVPYCKIGYASNNIKRSMFIFSKDTEIRNIWIRIAMDYQLVLIIFYYLSIHIFI